MINLLLERENFKGKETFHEHVLFWLLNFKENNFSKKLVSKIMNHCYGYGLKEDFVSKKEYKLSPKDWPDLALETKDRLVLIELKVLSGSIRLEQIDRYYEKGIAKAGNKKFNLIFLSPIKLPENICKRYNSDIFFSLTWEEVKDLIEDIDKGTELKFFLDQYLEYLDEMVIKPYKAVKKEANFFVGNKNGLDEFKSKISEQDKKWVDFIARKWEELDGNIVNLGKGAKPEIHLWNSKGITFMRVCLPKKGDDHIHIQIPSKKYFDGKSLDLYDKIAETSIIIPQAENQEISVSFEAKGIDKNSLNYLLDLLLKEA